jgi:hypothetical protein
MSDQEYFCNLPGVMMTRHRLTEGVVEINEDTGQVFIELWNGHSSQIELKGKADADVLKYAAHCLEYFAELEKDEDQGSAKKPVEIVAGGSPELNEFALR